MYQTVRKLIEKRQKEGKRNVDIGVNLSRMDLMDKNIMDTILNDAKSFRWEVSAMSLQSLLMRAFQRMGINF